MSVEITNKSGQLVPTENLRELMENSLQELKLNAECELNMVFVDEAEMTELHIKWMNEGGATDVLSFPMDLPSTPGEAVTLGDIVIAPTVAAEQALVAGHSIEHEIYILATHGLLHILGYDHAEKAEEAVMFALQEDLVRKWQASA